MATPSQRRLAAQVGTLTRWSRVNSPTDRRAALGPARDGMRSKLERQAIEAAGRELSPAELDAAVARLRRAQCLRAASASAATRRAKRGAA